MYVSDRMNERKNECLNEWNLNDHMDMDWVILSVRGKLINDHWLYIRHVKIRNVFKPTDNYGYYLIWMDFRCCFLHAFHLNGILDTHWPLTFLWMRSKHTQTHTSTKFTNILSTETIQSTTLSNFLCCHCLFICFFFFIQLSVRHSWFPR